MPVHTLVYGIYDLSLFKKKQQTDKLNSCCAFQWWFFFSRIRTKQMLFICCDKDLFLVFGILTQNLILSFFSPISLRICLVVIISVVLSAGAGALQLFYACFASYWKFLIFISIHSDDKYFFISLSLLSCSCSSFFIIFFILWYIFLALTLG